MSNSVSRRTFARGAAMAGALALTGGVVAAGVEPALAEGENAEGAAAEGAETPAAQPDKQYGFWFNTANCVACFDCVQ